MNDKTCLHSFAVFNCVPPRKEGLEPIIYWYYTPNENNSSSSQNNTKADRGQYYSVNQIGLIIAFISFCRRFDADRPCDYLFTNKLEMSMLELSGAIWMAVVMKSGTSRNRSLLNSVLQHCRAIFSTFFFPLKPIQEEMTDFSVEPNIIKSIDFAFPSIVNSINWDKLDFRYLFNSFVKQCLECGEKVVEEMCQSFLSLNSDLFDNIAILYHHNKVIYSSFDHTVTRILSFAMRRNFTHLFLHNPLRESDRLTWLIGLYINNAGLNSFYQPPIYYGGKQHLLLAFLDGNFKIVLSQPTNVDICEKMFQSVPKRLWHIRQFLKSTPTISPTNIAPLSFAHAHNSLRLQKLTFNHNNLDAATASRVDPNFVMVHDIATAYGPSAAIAYPERDSFFVRCEINGQKKEESLMMVQPTPGGISHCLKICSFVSKPKEGSTENTTMCSIG